VLKYITSFPHLSANFHVVGLHWVILGLLRYTTKLGFRKKKTATLVSRSEPSYKKKTRNPHKYSIPPVNYPFLRTVLYSEPQVNSPPSKGQVSSELTLKDWAFFLLICWRNKNSILKSELPRNWPSGWWTSYIHT